MRGRMRMRSSLHEPRPKHGPTRLLCNHITRLRLLTIPFIICMIAAAALATRSLRSQTANHEPLRARVGLVFKV